MTAGSLNFEYRGFRITVRGDGWVQWSNQSTDSGSVSTGPIGSS